MKNINKFLSKIRPKENLPFWVTSLICSMIWIILQLIILPNTLQWYDPIMLLFLLSFVIVRFNKFT